MEDELVIYVRFGIGRRRVALVPWLDDVSRGFGDGEVQAVDAVWRVLEVRSLLVRIRG